MSAPSMFGTFAALAVTLTLSSSVFAQSIVGKGKTGPVPNPVALDITGMFQEKYASVGDDMFIGGQPTEKALRELKAQRTTILLVEQNFLMAKALGDTVAVMDDGRIVHRGPMAELAADQTLQQRLLGLSLGAHQ